jgi:Cys-tRNA synthase (O-phospho-L-seryl-tRNA:Cys-tRNA synthase)
MTNLVIDASVARACGNSTTTHPAAIQCRDFLLTLKKSQYGVVMTEDIRAAWQEEPSRFAEEWLCDMTKQSRLKVIPIPKIDLEIRSSIEPMAKTDQERSAMNKDILLLEAALATDKRIVSLDENATYKYYIANKDKVVKFQQLIWVNPKEASRNQEFVWQYLIIY